MEKNLFTWDGWDTIDTVVFQFYSCTLVCDIFEHKTGDSFDLILMNYDEGTITLQKGNKEWNYKLNLEVGECV